MRPQFVPAALLAVAAACLTPLSSGAARTVSQPYSGASAPIVMPVVASPETGSFGTARTEPLTPRPVLGELIVLPPNLPHVELAPVFVRD